MLALCQHNVATYYAQNYAGIISASLILANIVIYPKTALCCLTTLNLLRHYHVFLMTRETRVMALFAAELSQQIALVYVYILPPLQDNSKLHMYNST